MANTDNLVVDADMMPATDTGAKAVDTLHSLEALIKEHSASNDRRREELKKLREMLTDGFSNDPTYQEHDKLAKEAAKVRAATKAQLLKQPSMVQLSQKVKDLFIEIKETEEGLSEYLREYARMSGENEIDMGNGEIRQIVYIAKLVKKSSRPR